MSLHPVRRAFAATGMALAGLSASAALAPISAQQALAEAQPNAACANTTGNYGQKATETMVRCEIREMDKRIQQNIQRGVEADKRAAAADQRAVAAERRGAEADRRGAEADQQMELVLLREACNDFLKAGRDAKRWTTEEVVARAGGKMTPDRICGVAKQLGYTGPTALLHNAR